MPGREPVLNALTEGTCGLGHKGVDAEVGLPSQFLVLVDLEGLAGRGGREGDGRGGADNLVREGIDDANLNI